MTVPASTAIPAQYHAAHEMIAELFAAALAAVDPAVATARVLGRDGRLLLIGLATHRLAGRVTVVGMGKAATGMAVATERALGNLIAAGAVVTTDGQRDGPLPERIAVLEAAHPLPDERSLAAAERLLDLVGTAAPDDVVIALISGGGSSLAEALQPPLTLPDLREVTDLLLRTGATIGELNAVRRALSRLKAGGLLARSAAPVYPLILSDVIGNDLGTIASGSVIPGPPLAERAAAARAVLDRYGLAGHVPAAVRRFLDAAAGTDARSAGPARPPVFVGDNARAVDAIVRVAEDRGQTVSRPPEWQGREGEASVLGQRFAVECIAASEDIDLIVGGGEATVTVRGDGVGGRNTEFALAAGLALATSGSPDWLVASLATDGQDGLTGAAGAIVDPGTVRRSLARGVNPERALRDNDSLAVFRAAGGLVVPGPTGTNVNDLYIGVRVRHGEPSVTREGDGE